MPKETIRCVVPPGDRGSLQYVKAALATAGELYKELGCSGEIILLVPSKQHLRHSLLTTAIGSESMDGLLKKNPVTVNGIHIRLESVRTLRPAKRTHMIVAVFPTQRMLDEIDEVADLRAVIVAADRMDDILDWVRTWNPKILGEESSQPEVLIKNPVLEAALKMITNRINLTMGLSLDDRDYTIGLLRCVNKYEGLEMPGSVRAWAVRNGWPPDVADDLAGIIQSIKEGKRIRVRRDYSRNCKSTIKMLRERSEGKG